MQEEQPQVIETPASSSSPARLERSARALIGWMTPDDALKALCGNRVDVEPSDQQKEQVARAHQAVAARDPGLDQGGVILPRPAELEGYVGELRQAPAAAGMFGSGWDVAVVDLSRVASFQPTVFDEQAAERVAGTAPDDVVGQARISLPIAWDNKIEASLDQHTMSIVASSPNPNLRVIGASVGPMQEGGPPTFGFQVSITASHLTVAKYKGRLFLRDGYHRAIGFLAHGIAQVPAFVMEVQTFEDLGVKPGMLPHDAFLGERPPGLADFLDDAVSAQVRLPAAQKMVVVHALELAARG
jgi:hypothetical protein